MPGTSAEPSPSGTWSPAPSAFNSIRGNLLEKRLPPDVAFHHRRVGSRWLLGGGQSERDGRSGVESHRSLAHPFQWRRHLAPPGRQSDRNPRRIVVSPLALSTSSPPRLDHPCRDLHGAAGPF